MIDQAAVDVTDEPTALNEVESPGSDPVSLLVSNVGAVTVYLGGEDVTVAAGVPVAAGKAQPVDSLGVGEALYGIVAAGTCEVRVLYMGVG